MEATGRSYKSDLIWMRLQMRNDKICDATVSKNGPVEPFTFKTEHFTKTGSGQT